jgi:hypothetical protein
MDSFGKSIPVIGPISLGPKEQVWFSEVRIFKSTKSGHVTYDVQYSRPANGDDIDTAVRAALRAVEQQLATKALHKG